MLDEYVAKMERTLATGVLNILILAEVERAGPIHGYALVRALNESTDETIAFKDATVYAILKEADKLQLVKSRWAESDSGPPRRYYEITSRGRQALDEAATLWKRIRGATDPILDRKGRVKHA